MLTQNQKARGILVFGICLLIFYVGFGIGNVELMVGGGFSAPIIAAILMYLSDKKLVIEGCE